MGGALAVFFTGSSMISLESGFRGGGTGATARLSDVHVAGKTGSSQVIKLRDSKQATPYQYRDHALFVAFAPYEKPEIAVAVVVEHGEHGGSAAGPVAGRIMRAWFDSKKPAKKEPVRLKNNEEEDNGNEPPAPPAKKQTVNGDDRDD